MSSGEPLLWRLLPDVRAGERSRFLFFAGLFMVISLGQTIGLAGAEALFLAELGIEDLASAFVAAAVFTVFGSLAYATRVGNAKNDVLFIQMLLGAAVVLVGGAFLVARQNVLVLPVLFCFWYLTQAIFLNHFWTFSGDFFDTLSSKRLVPIFTIGASIGGVVGGLLAAGLASVSGPASLIAAWGIALASAAAMLVFSRRALRRWGPLELEEADETSVENLRGAARYVGQSPLARWLVFSALGMVIAAFLAQYLYSDIFARRFPEPSELAAFFAIYFAVTNGIEILVEVFVTPRVIRRIGVPGANLIHPVLLLLSFGGLAWRYALPAAIGARVARETMDSALATPIRSLVQNAIPRRLRGRMRAFLEGIVVYAGMALAGLLLIALGQPDPLWLCAAGATAALFYLFANIRARQTYCDTLLEQLRAGRFDFAGGAAAIGAWEASRIADLWEESLRSEGPRPSVSVMQLIPTLASRGIIEPLVRATSHSNPAVRLASVTALASTRREELAGPLALAMDDSDPEVRLAALRGLAQVSSDDSFLQSRVDELLEDRDPRVRAEAASMAGESGVATLESMIRSSNAEDARAALAIAPADLLPRAIERTDSKDARIRAAALECAARLASAPPIDAQTLRDRLEDDEEEVRRAAALLAALGDTEDMRTALAGRLADSSSRVRAAAEKGLSSLGAAGIAAVGPSLRGDSEQTIEAALQVVAANKTTESRSLLIRELRHRVYRMWWYLLGFQHLGPDRNTSRDPLAAAFGDAILREWRLAFRVLELIESEHVIRKVLRELRTGGTRSRADALELLTNLGDRDTAAMLVLVHETGPLLERARFIAGTVKAPSDPTSIVRQALEADNPWVRQAARLAADAKSGLPLEENRMQQILALKQVDLFNNLSFEQLEAILQASGDAEYLEGEVIFREGEPGDKLFLLLDGSVEVIKNHEGDGELNLQTLHAVNYFGEMAILTEEPRSATTVAATACRLITLDEAAFRELLLQIPEISFEIFRVLTRRVRDAERKQRPV